MQRGQRFACPILKGPRGYAQLPRLPIRQALAALAQVKPRYPIRRNRREAFQVETELFLLEMPLTVLTFLVDSAFVRACFARFCLGSSALACFRLR